jgi:hypothetical protein
MRFWLLLLAFPLLALPVQAHAASAAKSAHHRITWEQRFAQANKTHDGHLTMDQAKAGYESVARHFDAIDTAKKGYVSEDDIRAYHKAQHASHRAPTPGKAQPSG